MRPHFFSWLVPLSLLGLPFAVSVLPHKRALLEQAFLALPYLAFALTAFVGEKLKRRRIVWLALLFTATYATSIAAGGLPYPLAILLAGIVLSSIGAGEFGFFSLLALGPIFYDLNRAHLAPHQAPVYFLSAGLLTAYGAWRGYREKIYRDELTGLANRRALQNKTRGLRPPYAITMLDLDHFQSFNDSFGSEQGDTVLRLLARHLSKLPTASVYRYGGAKICLVFEKCDVLRAAEQLDEIRVALAKREFHIRSSRRMRALTSARERQSTRRRLPVHLTFSAGVASPQKDRERPEEVLRSADAALHHAKRSGRNRIELATEDPRRDRRSLPR